MFYNLFTNHKNYQVMNKAQLIDSIAKKAKITKTDARKALDAFMVTTKETLKKGDEIALVGFGSFSTTKRSARKGRNPQTGKEMNIPARKVVRFRVGADLSKSVK
ncbi:MAG: HU family DNA-binding protein [Bacteroidota bacterium]